jgi:hypothetical protein
MLDTVAAVVGCKGCDLTSACVCHTHGTLQDSSSALQYAAFFADCEHELTRVTKGRRLALAYNLVWTSQHVARPQIKGERACRLLQQAVQRWEEATSAGQSKARLALPLGELLLAALAAFEDCVAVCLSC